VAKVLEKPSEIFFVMVSAALKSLLTTLVFAQLKVHRLTTVTHNFASYGSCCTLQRIFKVFIDEQFRRF
jgi:hypothetical protein